MVGGMHRVAHATGSTRLQHVDAFCGSSAVALIFSSFMSKSIGKRQPATREARATGCSASSFGSSAWLFYFVAGAAFRVVMPAVGCALFVISADVAALCGSNADDVRASCTGRR